MGQIPTQLLEDWEQVQLQDWRQSLKVVVVNLPCCRSSIEITRLEDQFIVCPNKLCGKRHFLTWSLNPKIHSESKFDMLNYIP